MSDTRRKEARRRAVIAFLLHAPGLALLTEFRFSTWLLRVNAVAFVLTVLAAGASGWMFEGHRVLAAIVAFAIGHFAWSAFLAGYVLRQGRLE